MQFLEGCPKSFFLVTLSLHFAIVPPSFTAESLVSPLFRKRDHFFVDKKKLTAMIQMGEIEPLDEKRRIWRYRGTALTPRSFRARSARISLDVAKSLQKILRSEITRTPMEAEA